MSRVSCCSALALLGVLVHAIVTADSSRPETDLYSTGKFERHRIKNLPGSLDGGQTLDQYAGHVTVDEGAGRALFYWLVEADVDDPQSAPLTLWLNGGPGCSSVGGGTLSELGPYFPSKDGKSLVRNPYSWNQVSNLIFLESPAGVGFSYSNTSSDYVTGNAQTATDSVVFILKFLELYPIYANRSFYIAGASYAGHYIPELAIALLEKNKELGTSAVNFKGIAIGNAWTDPPTDSYEAAFYWWSHALISDDSFNGLASTCNFSVVPLKRRMLLQEELTCDDYLAAVTYELGNISLYFVYGDVCPPAPAVDEIKHFAKQLNGKGVVGALGASLAASDSFDPCITREVEVYLNQPDVQKALHADAPGIPYRWVACSRVLNYSNADLLSTVLPLYEPLLKSGIQILIFSGDHDSVVPVTGSRAWIRKLNLGVKNSWRPYYVNDQVGGYVTEYDGLTFATVRGAGHVVPYTQPERGLYLFKSFIDNTPL